MSGILERWAPGGVEMAPGGVTGNTISVNRLALDVAILLGSLKERGERTVQLEDLQEV